MKIKAITGTVRPGNYTLIQNAPFLAKLKSTKELPAVKTISVKTNFYRFDKFAFRLVCLSTVLL